MTAAGDVDEVRLRDGSRVGIRPIEPADKALVAAGFAVLSVESRYRRFITPLETLDDHRLQYLTIAAGMVAPVRLLAPRSQARDE